MDFVKFYFPNGCTICNGKVILKKNIFKYICESCGAFADSHREDTLYTKIYEPSEALANISIHKLREKVRINFSKLYKKRVHVKGKHEIFTTPLINIIFADNIVKYGKIEDENFAQVINNKDNILLIKDLTSGNEISLNKTDTHKTSNRDKAIIWLSKEMKLSSVKCNIGYFNEEQLYQANKILTDILLKFNIKLYPTNM